MKTTQDLNTITNNTETIEKIREKLELSIKDIFIRALG